MSTKKMDSPAPEWYSDSRFSYFWQHYNSLMNAAHQNAVIRAKYVGTQTKAAVTDLQFGVYRHHSEKLQESSQASHTSRNSNRSKHRKNKIKRKQRNRRNKARQLRNMQENQSDTESLYSQMRQSMHIQDANDNMEVTEDFLIFLEQSKKHREEWKVLKAKGITQELNLKTEEVVPEAGPKEHPDVIRSREMQQLYGQAAPKLQAMETALQLSFDRNATLHQPQHWPNIPLNVMFT